MSRVAIVTSALVTGGAERILADLLRSLDRDRHECKVLVLSDHCGPIKTEIEELGYDVEVFPLNRGPVQAVRNIGRLWGALRRFRPATTQTWMYHADLIGGLVARLATGSSVVWGIHNDRIHRDTKPTTKVIVRWCAALSRTVPDVIICCSARSRRTHESLGYAADRMCVVTAGIDMGRFVPDSAARGRLRERLGVSEGTPLVGLVARYSPEKDHETFARAAARMARSLPDLRFILCGEQVTPSNEQLVTLLRRHALVDRVVLLGIVPDIVEVVQGLDLLLLASSSGSFGLVVAEAIGCGVPAVGTDVGEVRSILGDCRWVCSVGDAVALAKAGLAAISLTPRDRQEMLARTRSRISEQYNVVNMTQRYSNIWSETSPRGRYR